MLRLVPVLLLVLSWLAFVQAAAASDCEFCMDSVALQTRDGQPWSAGKPVTLVVHVTSRAAVPFPDAAQVVVMQTDGDRTKCLGVPLKLVEGDASGGLYAGLFFPFRPAQYDGKLVISSEVQDIRFDVDHMVGGAAPAGELPAAEPLDTSAPVPPLWSLWQLPAIAFAGVALGLVVVAFGRQRRIHRLHPIA